MNDFIECPSEQRENIRFHPTQKPEKVIEWLLEISSKKNGRTDLMTLTLKLIQIFILILPS